MKIIILLFAILIVFIPFCSAQDSKEDIQRAMNDASGQKTGGIVLTSLGGVVLAGSIVYFIYGYVDFLNSLNIYSGSSFSLGRMYTWLGLSIGGMVLGGVGLGIGIPLIIVGSIKETRYRNQLNSMDQTSMVIIKPIIALNTFEEKFILGFQMCY